MTDRSSAPFGGHDLQGFYGDMCNRGRDALLQGKIKVSEYLDDLGQDKRLGLTLIVRPSADVVRTMEKIIGRLHAAVPGRLFCYDRLRFHFTILSLLDAREGFEPDERVVQAFEEQIAAVIGEFLPFDVEFRGVCATPNSIIAKGFPVGDRLEDLRNALRSRLKAVGLGGEIDRRYRIGGAHVTLSRFRQNGQFGKLVALLDSLQEEPLGRTRATHAQLVCNDFYMTPGKVRTFTLIPNPSGRVTHDVPDVVSDFVGRDKEIDDVLRALTSSEGDIVVISGFGGIGKSELAKMAARSCGDVGWPFRFICWIDLRSYADASVRLMSILDRIALAANRRSDVPSMLDEDEKKRHVMATLKAQPSLVIFDNYEDLRRDEKEEQSVADFVASLPRGLAVDDNTGFVRILVTTRELLSLPESSSKVLELEKLSFPHADKLMGSRAWHGPGGGKQLNAAQRQIVWEAVGGVPKLIVLAMAQLKNMTFSDWVAVVDGPAGEAADEIADALYKHSWADLLSEEMKRILMALAHFAGEATPGALRTVAGLNRDAFWHELAYTSDGAYLTSTRTGYVAHPLAMQFYRRQLLGEATSSFWAESARRFIGYFCALARKAGRQRDFDAMERELRNTVTAARLADSLAKVVASDQAKEVRWDLIRLVESAADFLWVRGWWLDYEEMAGLAVEAAEELGESHYVARFLCLDLGWLALRKEELDLAEERIRRGLRLFAQLRDEGNLAMMTRHLGKLALLRGLDKRYYEPGNEWEKWFKQALRLYNESLQLRLSLDRSGNGQDEAIADLKLDLGRLYWLDGQHDERKDRRRHNEARLQEAIRKYALSYQISKEAITIYRALSSDRRVRGTAKAWGNCGNAARQMAELLLDRERVDDAKDWMKRAREHYAKSLDLAQTILRRDEIAHAYWGLGEVNVLEAALERDAAQSQRARSLLLMAKRFVEEAHELYRTLAGPRDVNATARLLEHIRAELRGPGV